jgi:hypothetical protein
MVLQSRDLYYDAYSKSQMVYPRMTIGLLAAIIDDNYREVPLPFFASAPVIQPQSEGARFTYIGSQPESKRGLQATILDLCGRGTKWQYNNDSPKGMIGCGNIWYVRGSCACKE